MTAGEIEVAGPGNVPDSDLMAGKFEVYKDRAGKYRFRLKAGNGEIVATGEAYESKPSALNGCEAVKKAANGASVVEVDS